MALLLVDIAQTRYMLHVELCALLLSLVPYVGPANTISRNLLLDFHSNETAINYAENVPS